MKLLIFAAFIGLAAAQCATKPDPVPVLDLNATIPIGFSSPGFNFSDEAGSAYPDDIRCEWRITNDDPSLVLQLSFANFSLETCTNCDCDFIKVYDGPTPDEANRLLTWCSDFPPDAVTASGQQMYVVFESNDYATDDTGFLARAGFPIDSNACEADRPDVIDAPEPGFFYTVNYPDNYRNNLECSWLFRAPVGQRTEVSFYNFDVENCCNCDWLEIYNGNSATARRMGHWYSTELPARMWSAGEEMFWRFSTDLSVRQTGFFGFYRFV